ncbi:hypothetical protein OIU74_006165 [Salix koriyanagi]|uniref:Uncharacterized protein n=1 Tax=Salix koriyanagi TaxID=2511006 RepID=A0A9Q0UDR8_9ROSI|nr:hypothetical protein OIU74_006165 [Salix koriyanagi]
MQREEVHNRMQPIQRSSRRQLAERAGGRAADSDPTARREVGSADADPTARRHANGRAVRHASGRAESADPTARTRPGADRAESANPSADPTTRTRPGRSVSIQRQILCHVAIKREI